MFETEQKKYKALNEFAECGGVVILGGTEDVSIPIGELKQAFSIEEKVYNRSMKDLSIMDACAAYKECVAPIAPETILLHMGDADLALFRMDAWKFIQKYNELISCVKDDNKNCRIAVISLRNYEDDATITELNKQLKYIAESNCCEFVDIANKRVWNPKSMIETSSFMYSMGFVRPLKCMRSLYDLVKYFFVSFA